jgi:hypothetical protein
MRTYQGILRGGGLEANCVVVETIHVQPMTGVEVPGKRSIQKVTPSLPDGLYMLSVDGEKDTAMRLHDGLWALA